MKHCDDYIDDRTAPKCLREFLAVKRAAAPSPAPALFATLVRNVDGTDHIPTLGGWKARSVRMHAGQRVRVVMASRFGDIGITPNLRAQHGYFARLALSELSDFADHP